MKTPFPQFELGDVVKYKDLPTLAEVQYLWPKQASVTIRWLISGTVRIVDRRKLTKATDGEIETFITEHLSPLRKK